MKFFRLTSVVLCCALLSSFLILSASASDDSDYYSAPVISEPSLAVEWPVNPVTGEYNSILGSIARELGTISSQISDVQKNQATIAQMLSNLSGIVTNNGKILTSIDSVLGSSQSILSAISDKVATEATLSAISGKVATETTLASLLASSQVLSGDIFKPVLGSLASQQPGYAFPLIKDREYTEWMSFPWVISSLYSNFSYDGFLPYHNAADEYTLYHWVKNLSQTLASDDDKKLAESQKENREQIEKDFLTGNSGKTSLGKDDFGSLSSVGGTFKDISSLNGQASLDSFSSGLTDADSAGQGWFSQSTKDALDSVSGSTTSESTVSTFSDDGFYSVDVDPDPYNMGGFEDNYSWLWGDK